MRVGENITALIKSPLFLYTFFAQCVFRLNYFFAKYRDIFNLF